MASAVTAPLHRRCQAWAWSSSASFGATYGAGPEAEVDSAVAALAAAPTFRFFWGIAPDAAFLRVAMRAGTLNPGRPEPGRVFRMASDHLRKPDEFLYLLVHPVQVEMLFRPVLLPPRAARLEQRIRPALTAPSREAVGVLAAPQYCSAGSPVILYARDIGTPLWCPSQRQAVVAWPRSDLSPVLTLSPLRRAVTQHWLINSSPWSAEPPRKKFLVQFFCRGGGPISPSVVPRSRLLTMTTAPPWGRHTASS